MVGGIPAPRVFGGVRLHAPECVRLEILDVARSRRRARGHDRLHGDQRVE